MTEKSKMGIGEKIQLCATVFMIFIIVGIICMTGFVGSLLLLDYVKQEIIAPKFQNVTLYDNTGQIVGQWTGDFSVTRNGDTTQIKNSERVIEITGGIVIAEGN